MSKKTKEKMVTRKELLIKVYNERFEHLIRAEIDAEVAQYLVIADPKNAELARLKVNKDNSLTQEKKNVEILKKKILLVEEGKDEQKN